MKTIEVKLFTFDELNDLAKNKARDWYLQGAFHDNWWQFVYEDAENIGLQITSFDTDRNRHAEGHFTNSACAVAQDIFNNHGENCETYKTAQNFMAQWQPIFDEYTNESHANYESLEHGDKLQDLEDEFLKSLLEDYSIILQKESDFIQSNESIDENIRCNEYTFLENGTRF